MCMLLMNVIILLLYYLWKAEIENESWSIFRVLIKFGSLGFSLYCLKKAIPVPSNISGIYKDPRGYSTFKPNYIYLKVNPILDSVEVGLKET